jgi:hypothetical protein
MIISSSFPGDNHDRLKGIQHDIYSQMVGRLWVQARDVYLNACSLVEVETELAVRVRAMHGFDHRTLQDAHDLIAAWYRFDKSDGGQLRFDGSFADYDTRAIREWRDYFEAEAGRLCAHHRFIRDVLNATAFGNTAHGYAAEESLRGFLKMRYGAMFRPREVTSPTP